MSLALAVACSFAFSLTNGFHDAANAIATLVATRGARPGQAVALSAVFNMLGAVLIGTAVADTIAGIVSVPADEGVAVIGAAAVATTGVDGVSWGGLEGWRPSGVFGVLIALAISPAIGFVFGAAAARLVHLSLRRGTRRLGGPVRAGEWGMSAALSFSHGANDAQKAMGVTAAILLAAGRLD